MMGKDKDDKIGSIEEIDSKMAFSVPGYLPQEVYEAGNYIIGEKVILFDQKQPEEQQIVNILPLQVKEAVLIKDYKKQMGKIIGKYPILFILSFAFTQDEVKDFLHSVSRSFRELFT